MSKKSNNPLDHVRVKQRGASWAYYFEKAKVDGKRRRGEGGGYATEQAVQRRTMPASVLPTTSIFGMSARGSMRETTRWSYERRIFACT